MIQNSPDLYWGVNEIPVKGDRSKWIDSLYSQVKSYINTRTGIDKVSSPKMTSTLQTENSEKSPQQEGRDEQIKNQSIKKEEDRQTVDNLVRKSNRCIISISSLFPWDFFPNTIKVEEGRVTFIFRQFMASQSHSVDIKDISNVFIESSLFFATLQVVSRTFIQNDIKIGNLSKKKSEKVHIVIEGLRTFEDNNIDTTNYEIPALIKKLEELHASK